MGTGEAEKWGEAGNTFLQPDPGETGGVLGNTLDQL